MNVRIVAPKTIAETTIAEQFAALRTADSDRAAAFAAFAAAGLPTRRNEAWHYTDLRSLMSVAAPLAPAPDAAASRRRARFWPLTADWAICVSFWSMAALLRNCPTCRRRACWLRPWPKCRFWRNRTPSLR